MKSDRKALKNIGKPAKIVKDRSFHGSWPAGEWICLCYRPVTYPSSPLAKLAFLRGVDAVLCNVGQQAGLAKEDWYCTVRRTGGVWEY